MSFTSSVHTSQQAFNCPFSVLIKTLLLVLPRKLVTAQDELSVLGGHSKESHSLFWEEALISSARWWWGEVPKTTFWNKADKVKISH